MISNNRIVVDLNKVQHALLVYRNQWGIRRDTKPKYPTVYGLKVDNITMMPAVKDYPRESILDRAKRRKLLDVWTPVLHLQMTANQPLEYTGDKALSIMEAWRKKQFGS